MDPPPDRPLSACCAAVITMHDGSDRCTTCGKRIGYALTGCYNAGEAPAVCEMHDGSWWFFYQQVSDWGYVIECVGRPAYLGQIEYLGQIKGVVDAPGSWYRQDLDRISPSQHQAFIRRYVGRVKNPDMVIRT